MTKPATEHRDYYVYALFREDGETPFYIGKGRGRRIDKHEWLARRETTRKANIIKKMLRAGLQIPKAKLVEKLTNTEASQVEIDLIRMLGRHPKGPLTNLTDGGDGVSRPIISSATIEKRRLSGLATWSDPEIRATRLAAIRKEHERRKTDPKHVEDETRRLQILKAVWADPVQRHQILERRRAYHKDNPMPEPNRRASAQRLNSPTAIAKRAVASRQPEVSTRRREAQRRAFGTPEAKAKRSAASKKMWAAKRAQKDAPPATES